MNNLIMVIFGGSGDLTRRKLIPALYKLYTGQRLPLTFNILGVGRTRYEDDSYRLHLKKNIKEFINENELNSNSVERFLATIHYISIDQSQEKEYVLLREKIEQLGNGTENYLFYLATPPSLYEDIPLFLKSAGLDKGRIVVEKPFGYDLKSAVRMNKIFKGVFSEEQIFRIDHFLGKETVQNILALRFANGIFEPLWNRNYIDRVEITAVENFGIENRGGFYDSTGALRDMVQNGTTCCL